MQVGTNGGELCTPRFRSSLHQPAPTSLSRMRRAGDEMVAPTVPQLTPEPGTLTALVLHASTDKMGENGG